MTGERRLIVNADEFGASATVNHGVIEAHRRGILTSATLLVTGAAAAEAAALARGDDTLGIGLEVALTGGPPVSLPVDLAGLVDARGRLPYDVGGLSTARAEDVLEETRAQHRRFRELVGRWPTHLSTHRHAHVQRPVFEALVTFAWETGLPVRGFSPAMRSRLRHEGVPTTDEFVDGARGGGVAVAWLLKTLGELGPGTTELSCCLASGGCPGGPGDGELAALTDERVRGAVRDLGIRLARFGES
jgi:predicted glycoside hydrolase/deacetylase ChbG (UPF0249 family)